MIEQSVGIVGVGRLGADVAFALAEQDLCDIVLYDQQPGRAEYLAADLSDTSFGRVYNRRIHAVTQVQDLADCDVILLAAGERLAAGGDQSSVFGRNRAIAEEVAQAFPGSSSIFVIASEPVDLMTAYLRRLLKVLRSRVLGIGGIVDAFVARNAIGDTLDVSPDYIHTHVVGPHGSGAHLVWAYTSINGVPIDQIADGDQIAAIESNAVRNLEERPERMDRSQTRYAPAMACVDLIRSIVRNERRILSVTVDVDDLYGLSGVAMSVPSVIGRYGADRVIAPEIDPDVTERIRGSVTSIETLIAGGAA